MTEKNTVMTGRNTVMTDKNTVRREQIRIRRELSLKEQRIRSEKLCTLLTASRIFREANLVCFYYPLPYEADLLKAAAEALRLGKTVAFPRTKGDTMEFFCTKDLSGFREGSFHVMEPVGNESIRSVHGPVLFLVPGVSFDRQGNRMGYGKGYYDRYFSFIDKQSKGHTDQTGGETAVWSDGTPVQKIGVAYEIQLMEQVPVGPCDIRMDTILTENGFFDRKGETMEQNSLQEIGAKAKKAEETLRTLNTEVKNQVLRRAADELIERNKELLLANEQDLAAAREAHMPQGLQDRLMLNEKRIADMAEGLRAIADLPDPIGEITGMKLRPNGLKIGQMRVPLGVIGIIYEARPNVTADAFGLCFKTGNAVILKGGKDAIHSNIAIVSVLRSALRACGVDENALCLITDTDRKTTEDFMRLNDYLDVLIPRGGAGLIRSVVEHATVPVIETGTGNCHIYVDEFASLPMAVEIIFNAKTQRIGVCNACESLVIHEAVADKVLPMIADRLREKHVELRGDDRSRQAADEIIPATEEDWGKEYLDYILSVKTVSSIDEAIAHINRYNTGHSEAIITDNYANAEKFLNEIDAAAVYVNASTRFTDGFEFGFGAEIGISTQKLHARGPMGLLALTSYKYVIYGNGQVRK